MKSETESDVSEEEEDWADVDSVEAILDYRSDSDGGNEGSVEGGTRASVSATRGEVRMEKASLGSGKSAEPNDEGENLQIGSRPERVEETPRLGLSGSESLGLGLESLNGLGGTEDIGLNVLVEKNMHGSIENGVTLDREPIIGLEESNGSEQSTNPAHINNNLLDKDGHNSTDSVRVIERDNAKNRSGEEIREGEEEIDNCARISVNKGKKGRRKRTQFDPKSWVEFVEQMASGGEMPLKGKKYKKGQKGSVAVNECSNRAGSGKECWEFGKKLGISSKLSDEDMAKLLEGDNMGKLGEKGKELK